MLYTRGNPRDYERWVRDYGATGWGYEDVLPHFKEIEDYRVGPVDRGTRMKIPFIFVGGGVDEVNFEGSKAVGVSFTRYGESQNVLAGREVILSAGTVGSAQLLLLSGVGPREQLEMLQIPVVADLPVGRNLQDHVVLQMAPPVSMDVDAGIPSFGLKDIQQYDWNKTGTISIPTSTEFMQFLHTAENATDADIPDIEIAPISTTPASELFKAVMVELGLMPEAFDGIIGPTDGRLGFRGTVILNRPKSRGSLTLRSADPDDDPDIDPRILEHPDDVRRAAEGTRKFIDQVLGTEAMQSVGAKPWNVTFAPCAEAGALWSQDYIECLFRHAAHTMWHLCCTVAMGSHTEAVLDERLRVRGNVTNLRVADASVMPDIVSGHTHAPAMMIGSKAAAMIIEDHGRTQ
ncbi:hypothetical protein MTO96_019494 [Rhipicephalus appendiculatus]